MLEDATRSNSFESLSAVCEVSREGAVEIEVSFQNLKNVISPMLNTPKPSAGRKEPESEMDPLKRIEAAMKVQLTYTMEKEKVKRRRICTKKTEVETAVDLW